MLRTVSDGDSNSVHGFGFVWRFSAVLVVWAIRGLRYLFVGKNEGKMSSTINVRFWGEIRKLF